MAKDKDKRGKEEEFVPFGLRKCPIKRPRKRANYLERLCLCDTNRCALWNDAKGRCGYFRY